MKPTDFSSDPAKPPSSSPQNQAKTTGSTDFASNSSAAKPKHPGAKPPCPEGKPEASALPTKKDPTLPPGSLPKLYEETCSEELLYEGRIIRVHVDEVLLENGKTAKREVVDHPGGVTVVVLTPENQFLFVRQFRYPYREVLLELPAGKLEPGEDPFLAMKREQLEETGTTGTDYHYLGEIYPSPGYCGEVIRLWTCRLDTLGKSRPDEDEFLETQAIPAVRALEMVMAGEIPDAKTQIGILKAAKYYGLLRVSAP